MENGKWEWKTLVEKSAIINTERLNTEIAGLGDWRGSKWVLDASYGRVVVMTKGFLGQVGRKWKSRLCNEINKFAFPFNFH